MRRMFNIAKAYNQSLSTWTVNQTSRMNSMLSGVAAFKQTLDTCGVSKVADMSYTIYQVGGHLGCASGH
jgi:hypothetical protein